MLITRVTRICPLHINKKEAVWGTRHYKRKAMITQHDTFQAGLASVSCWTTRCSIWANWCPAAHQVDCVACQASIHLAFMHLAANLRVQCGVHATVSNCQNAFSPNCVFNAARSAKYRHSFPFPTVRDVSMFTIGP